MTSRAPDGRHWMPWMLLLSLFVLCGVLPGPCPAQTAASNASAKSGDHPLVPCLKAAEECKKSLAKVTDYTTLFRNSEVVRGKRYSHTMYVKFREKPFSVYMYFMGQNRGRQILYVKGQNSGKLVARQPALGGLGVTVSLSPTGSRAMSENRHPITMFGMSKMVDQLITQWKSDSKQEGVKVAYYPNAKLKRPETTYQPMECKVYQTTVTKRRRGQEFYMTRLYIDKKTGLPVRVEQYGFPTSTGQSPPLLAEYTYWNVKTNMGLKDLDFSRQNPRYRF